MQQSNARQRLFRLVRPSRGELGWGLVASLFAAVGGAIWTLLLGPLLAALLTGQPALVAGQTVALERLLEFAPWVLVGAGLIRALGHWVHATLAMRAAARAMATLRTALFARLVRKPPLWFEDRHSGDLLARFTTDLQATETALVGVLTSVGRDSLFVLMLLGACFAINPWLFAITFVVLPVTVVPLSRFARSMKKSATRAQASVANLSVFVSETLQGLAAVQAFNAEALQQARFAELESAHLDAMKQSLRVRSAFTPTLEFIATLGVAAALAFGVAAVARQPSLGPTLVTFLAAALLLYQPLKALTLAMSLWGSAQSALDRILEIVDTPDARDPGEPAPTLHRALEFKEVVATYPDGRAGLSRFSLAIPAGHQLALVGPSGSGKSSALATVLGFLPVSSGAVLWDGTPLTSFSRASVRTRVAWVPQEPWLVSGTVRDNLRLGRPEADDAALWSALESAGASSFIKQKPGGLDFDVGEHGSRLSGGERQRVALARALVGEPSVLLLDEPTSALDAHSEQWVTDALERLKHRCTVVVVAHRLSTVRRAEQIAVVRAGAVVEQGTHEALLASGGVYARLVNASHGDDLYESTA